MDLRKGALAPSQRIVAPPIAPSAPPLFPNASRLGLGCASLGSRIGKRAGQRAMEQAFERGMNWFDLSPSYGDGEAEVIFATFARSLRDRVHICTKVGMAAGAVHPFIRALRPLAQRVVTLAPGLRPLFARGRPRARKLPLQGRLILSSLEDSLRRLRTDHVEVLALHYPEVEDLAREDVLRALQTVTASGKARAVGIAGAPLVARTAVEGCPEVGHIQFAAGLFGVNLVEIEPVIAAARSVAVHSLFAHVGALQFRLEGRARETRAALAEHGYDMEVGLALRAAMLDLALAQNSKGVVVLSAFTPPHLDFALERLERHHGTKAAALLQGLKQLSQP